MVWVGNLELTCLSQIEFSRNSERFWLPRVSQLRAVKNSHGTGWDTERFCYSVENCTDHRVLAQLAMDVRETYIARRIIGHACPVVSNETLGEAAKSFGVKQCHVSSVSTRPTDVDIAHFIWPDGADVMKPCVASYDERGILRHGMREFVANKPRNEDWFDEWGMSRVRKDTSRCFFSPVFFRCVRFESLILRVLEDVTVEENENGDLRLIDDFGFEIRPELISLDIEPPKEGNTTDAKVSG